MNLNFDPRSILFGQVVTEPWTHTVTSMDKQLQDELSYFFNHQDWDDISVDDIAGDIRNITLNNYKFDYKEIPHACNFLKQMQSKEFHKEILEYYDLDTENFNANLCLDKVGPQGKNGIHNDIEDYENIITLQFYLRIDDPTRNLQLNGQTLEKCEGHGIMFNSSLNTMHSFNPGQGERHSVRLRIRHQPLVDPTFIHQPSDDDLTVIIDCKDMETGYDIKGGSFNHTHQTSLELGLGTFTYHSCLDNGFSNIILFRNMKDFDTAISTAKTNKILILFAGSLVSKQTYRWAKNESRQCGEISNNSITRKFFLFDKSKIQGNLNNHGNYLQDQINNTFNTGDVTDIFYKHPDDDSKDIMEAFYNYEPETFGKDAYRLIELFKDTITKKN